MTYTIETKDYVHIPEHSIYNHNYYRNDHTGEVILKEYEDDGFGTYYNFGINPTFTRDDMKTAIEMGFSNYEQGFSDDVLRPIQSCLEKNHLCRKKK